MKYHDFDSMPLVINVDDLADTLGLGKNKAYELVNSGQLKALRIGNHFRIPREVFIDYIRSVTTAM